MRADFPVRPETAETVDSPSSDRLDGGGLDRELWSESIGAMRDAAINLKYRDQVWVAVA